MPREGHTTITVSEQFYSRIKLLVKKLNDEAGYRKYRSVSHFVEESIMEYHQAELSPLEHFNLSERGVTILDRKLGNGGKGRLIDVYFKPDKVWCDHCQSSNCEHVQFALSLPKVQAIIRKKGWQITT